MRVLSYEEAAGRMGVVRRSLERLIARGEGPAVITCRDRDAQAPGRDRRGRR
jgi:hypothetical protein